MFGLYFEMHYICIKIKQRDMNTTLQHEAFINNPESVNSLMAHVISNNLDISTQEKFTEAMQSWYKTQRHMDKKIDEMPINVLIKTLKI